MKVRVAFTVEVDDRFRRALRLSIKNDRFTRLQRNDTGLASRNEVRSFFMMHGDNEHAIADLIDENLEPLEFMEEHGLVNPHGGGLTEEEMHEASAALREKRAEVDSEAYDAELLET